MESDDIKKYQANYAELPFENSLREYRWQNIYQCLEQYPHKKILEIGCGFEPLFKGFDDFEKMLVVERGDDYYKVAKALAGVDKRIEIINGFFENVVDSLVPQTFDFIIIGGFLHEIDNPGAVLQAVKKLCTNTTVVHSFVPNAHSFHRLVAYEMGLIKDVYQKSGHDELFQRVEVYNIDAFKNLFIQNGFTVADCGTYFIKPFAHSQMNEMVNSNIIGKAVLDGLNKMTKYFPEQGAEIYINGQMS
jgi:SAM-dependent methyltransferase